MPRHLKPSAYGKEAGRTIKPIEGVPTSVVGFVGRTEHVRTGNFDNDSLLNVPTPVADWSDFVAKFGAYDGERAPCLPPAVRGFFDNGGKRCFVVRVKDGATDKDYAGEGSERGGGLQALADLNEIGILCVPGATSATVQQAMLAQCEALGDRFCILDPKRDARPGEVVEQRQRLFSPKGYGALYYPWVRVHLEGKENGRTALIQTLVPPSGHVAGVYARIDAQRGVHKAPAGAAVKGALEIGVRQADFEALNSEGVNCICTFPGRGTLVWGERTLASESEWKYINVRRLSIHVERSIQRGFGWAASEPNDEALWARVRDCIAGFLTRLWRQGALCGARPEEAFFVRCDRSTMTQSDVAEGKLIAIIGIAVLRPGAFLTFRTALKAGGTPDKRPVAL